MYQRQHLAQQGLQGITALHYPLFEADTGQNAATLRTALGTLLDNGPADLPDLPLVPTLLDLTSADQLASVGRLLWQQAQHARLLAVGPSSVAQALIAHWGAHANHPTPALAPSTGPVFAWAGSLSPITAAQVQAAASYQRISVDAQRLGDDAAYAQATQRAICAGLQQGCHVLAYTGPTNGAPAPSSGASAAVAPASAALVAGVVQAQADNGTPLGRIGIAGGDTSSHAVQALQLWGLSYKTTVCPGVTLSSAHSSDPSRHGLELMLKGGQMGGTDLFERLLGAG